MDVAPAYRVGVADRELLDRRDIVSVHWVSSFIGRVRLPLLSHQSSSWQSSTSRDYVYLVHECNGGLMRRAIFEPEHEALRATARNFFEKECAPRREDWAAQGHVDRWAWTRAGELGLLGFDVPEEFDGPGIEDWRFNAVVAEEAARCNTGLGLVLQNDVVAPYLLHLGTDEQKKRWLPGLVSGEIITAIAMSEPGAGSDLAR